MTDKIDLIHNIEMTLTNLYPELDKIKVKLRLEEILNNYVIKERVSEEKEKDLLENINLYINSKRLEGLSEITLEDYYRELAIFDFKVKKPTVSINTTDIRTYLMTCDGEVSTKGKKLSVIKSFFSWLVDEEIILKNPARRIKQIKQPKRLPKSLSVADLEEVRDSCETLRERAMIELLYSTGCRLSEVSNMKKEQVNWANSSVTVIGKGNKERIVYINPRAKYHLKKYLAERDYAENDCEFVLSTARRPYRQLQNKSIQDAIEKIAERADITKKITPHVFRHTFATLAMENGIELGDLQQLMGHESADTTLRYAQVSEERKSSAHRRYIQ